MCALLAGWPLKAGQIKDLNLCVYVGSRSARNIQAAGIRGAIGLIILKLESLLCCYREGVAYVEMVLRRGNRWRARKDGVRAFGSLWTKW